MSRFSCPKLEQSTSWLLVFLCLRPFVPLEGEVPREARPDDLSLPFRVEDPGEERPDDLFLAFRLEDPGEERTGDLSLRFRLEDPGEERKETVSLLREAETLDEPCTAARLSSSLSSEGEEGLEGAMLLKRLGNFNSCRQKTLTSLNI